MAEHASPGDRAPDPSRRIPSDVRPKSIAEKLRIKRLAAAMFPNGLQVENAEPDGPHYLALVAFLKRFNGTPHERDVWNVYFDWSRPKPEELPHIDKAAAEDGLTQREFIAREVVIELQRFIRAQGIAMPEECAPAAGVRTDDAPLARPLGAVADAMPAEPAVDVQREAGQNGRSDCGPEAADVPAPTKRTKRSTANGDARAKLIAALTKHHQYADGSCLNLEPIGNNELARLAAVDKGAASLFFKREFEGHSKYRVVCADTPQLIAALKLLNGEFAPHLLCGGKAGETVESDEE